MSKVIHQSPTSQINHNSAKSNASAKQNFTQLGLKSTKPKNLKHSTSTPFLKLRMNVGTALEKSIPDGTRLRISRNTMLRESCTQQTELESTLGSLVPTSIPSSIKKLKK